MRSSEREREREGKQLTTNGKNDLCAKHIIFLSFVESTGHFTKMRFYFGPSDCDEQMSIYVSSFPFHFIFIIFVIISKAYKMLKINSVRIRNNLPLHCTFRTQICMQFFYNIMELDDAIPVRCDIFSDVFTVLRFRAY